MLKRILASVLVLTSIIGGAVALPGHASAAVDGVTLQSCYYANTVVGYGSTGPCVKVVQRWLNDIWGDYHLGNPYPDPNWPGLVEDGVFGQNTYNAVRSYQAAHGNLAVDGVVGQQTYAAMFWECAARNNAGHFSAACY